MFLEKAKEHEKQREEEYYKKNGCPVQHGETKFFETIDKLKKEREKIYLEISSQLQ